MTFSAIFFLTRKPSLTLEEFKSVYENKHLPLLQSLFGPAAPLRYRRYYVSQTISDIPVTPASPPPSSQSTIDETSEDPDYDCIAELWWADEKTFHDFNRMYKLPGNLARIAWSEDEFLVRGKLRAIVIGNLR
ncbi:hypothetical protein P171DRAFT_348310 [Karstenula rhodostoma CBS 690.94]|uniref:EthD domain-containing protein n=1 Tax=Karstenula rhodostoma CBS 690.94 TaxID=1392251 RepID=A0A9P4PSQ5_9PLEO|nr:hypothetical protein P171DRAFT_348310 [Karstenula rhodostoma CBS 690.94]